MVEPRRAQAGQRIGADALGAREAGAVVQHEAGAVQAVLRQPGLRRGGGALLRAELMVLHCQLLSLFVACLLEESLQLLALGDAAAMPVQGMLKHFRDEFAYHVEHKTCMVPATL